MHYFTNGTDSDAASSNDEMPSIPLDYLTSQGSCQSEGMGGQKEGGRHRRVNMHVAVTQAKM